MNAQMSPTVRAKFNNTCFGHYLNIVSTICDSLLLHGIALTQIPTDTPQEGISYQIGHNKVTFTPTDFCLISGLKFGVTTGRWNKTVNSFKNRLFPNVDKVKVGDVQSIFESDWSKYDDDDVVRICLITMIERCFKGSQKSTPVDSKIIDLVDNLEQFNAYPWGSYFWDPLYKNLNNMCHRHRQDKMGYGIAGPMWAFKVICVYFITIFITHSTFLPDI